MLSNSALSAPAHQKLTICHATRSNTNPYVQISPNINATGLAGGHITHVGPIWDPTIKGTGGSWGDIIPPFTYQPKSGPAINFPGLNWTAAGQAILANGCAIPAVPPPPTTVTPENPTVTEATCNSDHNVVDPTLTLPVTAHITYTAVPAGPYHANEQVVVTATAETPGFQFVSPGPGIWVFQDSTHETWTHTFAAAPTCTLPANGVAPGKPTITEASCVGNPSQLVGPTLTLPSGPAGVTYTASASAPFSGGQTVKITAVAVGTNVFSDPGHDGWTFVNAHRETFTVTFDAAPTCSGNLANTGVNSVQLGEIGGIVLLFGFGLQFLSMGMRRREML